MLRERVVIFSLPSLLSAFSHGVTQVVSGTVIAAIADDMEVNGRDGAKECYQGLALQMNDYVDIFNGKRLGMFSHDSSRWSTAEDIPLVPDHEVGLPTSS